LERRGWQGFRTAISINDLGFTIYELLPHDLTAMVLGVLNSGVAKQQTEFFQKDEM
jgi:hypothetical protein